MSATLAVATFVAGFAGAGLKKRAGYKNAYERRRAAHQSLLTAKYNIAQVEKEGKYKQFQILNAGGNAVQDIAIEGKKAVGAGLVSSATSGAVADTGSTRQALDSMVREALVAQTETILATKNQIRSVARQTENQNRSEWRNALLNNKQQNRVANNEIDAANNQFTADMINTAVKTGAAYKTSGLSGNTTSAVNLAADSRSATGGKGDSSMTSSPYDQRGTSYKPTYYQTLLKTRKRNSNSAVKIGRAHV